MTFYIKKDNGAMLSTFVMIAGKPVAFWVAQPIFAMRFETEEKAKEVLQKLPNPDGSRIHMEWL